MSDFAERIIQALITGSGLTREEATRQAPLVYEAFVKAVSEGGVVELSREEHEILRRAIETGEPVPDYIRDRFDDPRHNQSLVTVSAMLVRGEI